jgi:hypothetical protein
MNTEMKEMDNETVKCLQWLVEDYQHKYFGFDLFSHKSKKNVLETEAGGAVYALYNPLTKLTKIGMTYNVYQRFRQLVTQSGCNLKCVAVGFNEVELDMKIGMIESYLHEKFKDYRVVGEWFNLRYTQRFALMEFLINPDIFEGTCWMHDDVEAVKLLSIRK